MKKTIVALLLITVLLLVVSACSKPSTQSKGYTKNKITINMSTNFTSAMIQIIRLKDLLTPLLPEDVTVEWASIETGNDIRDAAVSGRVDFVSLSSPTVINSFENGLPLRIISNCSSGYAKLLSTKDSVNSLSDLNESSKVTVSSKGSYLHLLFALRCAEVFGDAMIFDDNIVSVSNVDALGLMQSSQDYDAFVLSFPTCDKLPEGTAYHMVEDLTQTALRYDLGTYILATEEMQKDNPVIVTAFRKASEQAVDLLLNQTDEMAALLAEYYGVEATVVAEAIRQCPPKLEISESGYDAIADLMYQVGMLKNPPKKFSELPNYNDIPKR